MKPKPKHILIPDGCSTWAVSVIRCLAYCPEYKVFVLSSKKRTPAKYSNSIFYFKYYPKSDDRSWLKILNHEIDINNIDLVLPIAESAIRFLIKHSEVISKTAKVIDLPTLEAFENAIDKYKLGIFCDTHSLPYPKFVLFENVNSFKNELSINYPALIKPALGKGGEGIIFLNDSEALKFLMNKDIGAAVFFIQEYVKGYDIDCSVLCNNGEILTYTVQKGFLDANSPFKPCLGIEFLNNADVYKVVEQLMFALKWSGVAHIDMRYDSDNNTYKIIEVNGRFWGSVEASRQANINFPLLVCDHNLGKEVSHTSYELNRYMRFKGVIKYIKKHPSYLFSIKSILTTTEVKAVLKDPVPTIFKFLEWINRKLSF